MSRKLVTIQKIKELNPIPNADSIEVATILGWKVVVRKGEFKVDDLVVYAEIDSVFPEKPEFEFLRERKFRIRTVRLRGQISQGIAFPYSLLGLKGQLVEGEEVTELLGVTQYIPQIPANISGEVKGVFPSFIPKTDETRVQLLQDVLTRHKGTRCYVTEKVDGCLHYRMRIKTDKGDIEIGKIVNKKLPVRVLTYDEENKCCEYKEIEQYHKYPINEKKWIRIGTSCKGKGNREKYIDCTNNHHFYTNKGWIEAKDLKVNDVLHHYSDTLDTELKEIILGCLLGDSSIYSTCENYKSIHFGHSILQKEYFDFKKRLFGNLFIKQAESFSGFGSLMLNGLLKTNLSILELINSCCLKDNKKKITKEWCEKLTPLSLAFWYMDDGNLKHRNEDLQKPRCMINSQGFSYEENLLLKTTLKDKFNINVEIGDKEVYMGYVLLFDKEDTEKFCSLIAPYVCESMKYKLPEKFENWKCCLDNVSFGTNSNIIPTKVLNIKELKKDIHLNSCYDLTIKDNHNYFAYNILVHNSSVTYFYKDGEFGVCSRNLELRETEDNLFWKMARTLKIEEKLKGYYDAQQTNMAIQGELIGRGIQKNNLRLPENKVLFFNVFNIDKFEYLNYQDAFTFLAVLDLEAVPVVGLFYELDDNIDNLIEKSKGFSLLNPKIYREGIVIRPMKELVDLQMSSEFNNGRVSFKAINPEYLLKYEE